VFVDRTEELEVLEDWWREPRQSIALVWGRRRVGKTALLQAFAAKKPTVFHVFTGLPVGRELAALAEAAAEVVHLGFRQLRQHPFVDWSDAILTLAAAADHPLLLVLDEFPLLLESAPNVPNEFRAVWEQVKGRTQLRVLLCGSATRVMEDLQRANRPLYGRLSPKLLLHPFRPHEAALMLPRLEPADRALVWGILGGIPLYLEHWDQEQSIDDNLYRLFLRQGAPLLSEGELMLAYDFDRGQDLTGEVLRAVAEGASRWSEIKDAVGGKPERALQRLLSLRLVERRVPVTEEGGHSRRAYYRICDNFLRFWLGVIAPHRAQIERGLGRTVLPALKREIDELMGSAWEDAFRWHLVRLANEGRLGEVVAVGSWWSRDSSIELDAVVLSGRAREVTLVGEAKWARRVDGSRLALDLRRRALSLPRLAPDADYAICAREEVRNPGTALAFTAADIFA
jgi:AAA+ ATPase superfamily predicted ATPase